jgi:hypothetical protein
MLQDFNPREEDDEAKGVLLGSAGLQLGAKADLEKISLLMLKMEPNIQMLKIGDMKPLIV